MIKQTLPIINKLGLHARASAKFVSLAGRFQSEIKVTRQTKTVDGKSIMGVMMLGANQGSELVIEIEGPDEQEMSESIANLVNTRFGEAE